MSILSYQAKIDVFASVFSATLTGTALSTGRVEDLMESARDIAAAAVNEVEAYAESLSDAM